jgi:hypothetical protein
MIPLRHCLLLTLAASATGCFDDAKLRPYDAGDDLAPVDVPITPADVPEDDGAAAVDGPDGSLDADLDADLDAALDATDDAVTADDLPRPDVPPGECPIDRVLVGTSDSTTAGGYALGRFVPTPSLVARTESAPDYDHLVVQSGCVVYDLLRGADELAVLDPLALPTVARRISLRSAMGSTERYQANPSAVLTLSPQVAYVALYNAPRVAVVDPTMSGPDAVRRVINLAPLRSPMDRDANGALEAAAIVRAGRNVFVALQNLNGGMPVTNGTLAVLDPTGDVLLDTEPGTTEIDPVRLTGRNPTGMRLTPGGRLVVAEPGAPGPQASDGIEVVDPVSFAARGIRVTEAQLGGDVGDFIMLDDARGWVVVRQSGTSSRVVEFDLDAADGMRAGRTIMSSGSIGALARDPSGNVWVLDRSAGRAGARVFNTMGTELTMMPLAAGTQSPTSVAFVP